jgi:N-acetylglutamate synthase-like GNAT family acetyltransferase
MDINIRIATFKDLDWINQQYKTINFLESNLENEDIIIAEANGIKAALGRLQKIKTESSELGGIYVLPKYRKNGIARKIVSELIIIGKKYQIIYCLPFSHLQDFYISFGFDLVLDTKKVPGKVLNKHKWCNSTYNDKVLLLAKQMH